MAAITNATKPGASGGVGPGAAGVNTAGAGAGAAAEADAAAALNNSGPILAIEALTVASMNVFSWAIMATGGALWYFDIASMEDLRRSIRGGMGVDGTGRTEEEAEQEMEEWLATVLSRKDDKRTREEETRVERQKRDREEFAEFQRFKNERGQER
jgi:predicted RNase H-like HicB family nuclease